LKLIVNLSLAFHDYLGLSNSKYTLTHRVLLIKINIKYSKFRFSEEHNNGDHARGNSILYNAL